MFLISFLFLIFSSCSTVIEQKPPAPNPDIPDIVTPTPDNSEKWKPSTAFKKPWENTRNSIIIDAYEGNPINWDEMSKDKRVKAVIHRSSIGLRLDKKYQERKVIAKNRGYLWGAYHFGKSGDVIKQADLLLSLVDEGDLIVLDLEDFSRSGYMKAHEAIEFIEYVYSKTGIIPVVYANNNVTKQMNAKYPNHSLLKKSKLWYARFKSTVTDFPVGIWKGYYLWQFSSEINCNKTGSCLYNVPGTRYDMDVNIYEGELENW